MYPLLKYDSIKMIVFIVYVFKIQIYIKTLNKQKLFYIYRQRLYW